jgi:hypothetical protein
MRSSSTARWDRDSLGRGRVEERHDWRPAGSEDLDERWRCDRESRLGRTPGRLAVAGRRPTQERVVEDEPRVAVSEHERAVGKTDERDAVKAAGSRLGVEPFGVEPHVDRVGAAVGGVEVAPDRGQPVVVGAAAERARPMAGRKRGRVVEEEQLGEPARLQ